MTQPVQTPNPATSTQPRRSSERVVHKKPLVWLPWLALLALLALAALLWWAVSEANEGSSKTAASAGVSAPAVTGPAAGAAPTVGAGTTGTGSAAGSGLGAGAGAGAGALAGALVGGAGLSPIPATNIGAAAGSASGPAGQSAAQTAAGNSAPGTAGTVLFGQDSATPDAAGQQVIAAAAKSLTAADAKSVEVRGYTDIVAGAPVNAPLSQQRADAVASALRAQLPGVAVTGVGKGEADPVAGNDSPEGRQQNRRVVIAATS